MRYHVSTYQQRKFQKQLLALAQKLRKNPTPAEHSLWIYLKAYKTFPVRFRRQYTVLRFKNEMILYNIKNVLAEIELNLITPCPSSPIEEKRGD